MRELKFRAWDKNKKKWIAPFDKITVDGEEDLYWSWLTGLSDHFNILNDVLPFVEIMQYTGLKDKDGKEIYEGDIVSWYHNGIKQTVMGKIVWDDLSASFRHYTKLPSGGAIMCHLGYYLNKEPVDMSIEIIGNIYENPDLTGNGG